MKRTAIPGVFLFAAAALILLAAGPGAVAGEGSEDPYIVRPGDTLSGIAGKLLGDTKRWPELLEANPQVTDPQVIFPGDTIVLPGAGEKEGLAADTVKDAYPPLPVAPPVVQAPPPEAEPVEPELPVEMVKLEPTINENTYRAAGYISTELPQDSIVSSLNTHVSLVEGDEVFLSVVAEEGAAFTVIRPTRKVYHPVSGEFLGWVMKVMGWAEVTCAGETSSRAILSNTVDVVNVGDLIVPFDPEDVLEENILKPVQSTFCLEKGDVGYIVASQENRISLVDGDLVFLDKGQDAGVEPGNQFVVYKKLDPEGYHVIGIVQVLRTGSRTSTALVTYSMRAISVTDRVQAWEAPVTEEVSSGG
jgi:LysM repeat protein